jgi:hypothetical protein
MRTSISASASSASDISSKYVPILHQRRQEELQSLKRSLKKRTKREQREAEETPPLPVEPPTPLLPRLTDQRQQRHDSHRTQRQRKSSKRSRTGAGAGARSRSPVVRVSPVNVNSSAVPAVAPGQVLEMEGDDFADSSVSGALFPSLNGAMEVVGKQRQTQSRRKQSKVPSQPVIKVKPKPAAAATANPYLGQSLSLLSVPPSSPPPPSPP